MILQNFRDSLLTRLDLWAPFGPYNAQCCFMIILSCRPWLIIKMNQLLGLARLSLISEEWPRRCSKLSFPRSSFYTKKLVETGLKLPERRPSPASQSPFVANLHCRPSYKEPELGKTHGLPQLFTFSSPTRIQDRRSASPGMGYTFSSVYSSNSSRPGM